MKSLKSYYPFLFVLTFLSGVMLVKINTDNTKTNRIENSKLSLILQQITEDYMDSIQIENLEEKTIESLLQNLDPHSVYISKEDFHAANDDLAGRFDGIGVEFRMIKDTVVVIQALENGPSKRAGIQSGDRLLIANGDTLFGKNLKNTDIQHKIKGEKGTIVNLTVKRVGLSKPLNFVLTREAIPTFSIDAKFMINEETAYLKLSRFSATTTKEIKAALELLIEEGMQNLILDLRGNSGGFLEAAISVSNQFLDKGKTIVFTKGKNRPKDIYKANNNGLFEKGNLILLIDENSASASEIVAGAIQDNDRGIIIGRKSFGKGLIQEQINFKDGSALRLSVSRYYTPSGRSIQKTYENGTAEYYKNYYESIHHSSLDTSKLKKNEKFKTISGKTVYGGGGIWPDILISYDTAINFSFYNYLQSTSIIYELAYNYAEKNKSNLANYKTIQEYLSGFKETKKLVDSLYNSDAVKKLKSNPKDLIDSKPYIEHLLKSEIARIVYPEGFYQVYITNDKFVLKALEKLKEN